MDMRAEVWSPLQNTAVWLGSWLWGHETTDDLLDALKELGGRPESVDEAPLNLPRSAVSARNPLYASRFPGRESPLPYPQDRSPITQLSKVQPEQS